MSTPHVSGRRPKLAAWALATLLLGSLAVTAVPANAKRAAAPPTEPEATAENMELVASLPAATPDDTGSDIAFWRDLAVFSLGAEDPNQNNDGFVVVDISDPRQPQRLGEFRCQSSYDDISMWRDLVFLTVNVTLPGTNCDGSGGDGPFSGIRIVSIADPLHPVQIATVNQNCGRLATRQYGVTELKPWINHTTVPDLAHRDAAGERSPRLLIYTSGSCGGGVVEVPLRDPRAARQLRQFATAAVPACHDLSVFVPRRLAAVGCFTETQIWDLANLEAPRIIARIHNPAITGHHGTSFSWDGDTLLIADERGGFQARRAREHDHTCAATSDAPLIGGIWFYDITNATAPVARGQYLMDETEKATCSPHDFNVVPLRDGRDVLVTAWYRMGTRVVDFTDPTAPREVAHYAVVDGPPARRTQAWASYWYNGFVYSNNMFFRLSDGGETYRGFDVLSVDYRPLRRAMRLGHLNPQTQEFLIDP